jgi:hypothetical protein
MIKFILEWISRPDNNERILWLSGLAGSGKSTISATIADFLRQSSRLGSLIFFDRDEVDLKRPELVIRQWADGLASFDPCIAEALNVALKKTPSIIDEALGSQFTRLIVEPLSSNPSLGTDGPIIMIIDALDECDNRHDLLSILASDLGRLPPFIKILITSRDEADIRGVFRASHHIVEKPLDIYDVDTVADVPRFLEHQFCGIRSRDYAMTLPEPWPAPDAMTELERRAGGLFIWASTICKFIKGDRGIVDHEAQLELILGKTSCDAESPIDKLYSAVLAHSYNPQHSAVEHDLKLVLSTLVAAQTPLSLVAIAQFLQYIPGKTKLPPIAFVQPLGSLLSGTRDQNALLRPLHPSFYEFLTVEERSHHYYIDSMAHSAAMAAASLDIIIHRLTKDDICRVGDSFYRNGDISDCTVDQSIPEALRYACRFLVDHIVNVNVNTVDLLAKIKIFLFRHLLHWIEALSLMKMLHVAHSSLLRLDRWIMVCPSPSVNGACLLTSVLESCL